MCVYVTNTHARRSQGLSVTSRDDAARCLPCPFPPWLSLSLSLSLACSLLDFSDAWQYALVSERAGGSPYLRSFHGKNDVYWL